METVRAPSLLDLRIKTAIDNRKHLGDVGDVNVEFLEQILSHCSKEELMHIEKSTKGRDLSPVTDKFWKRIYEEEFGRRATDDVIEKMRQRKVSYKWSKLYLAKSKSMEEDEREVGDKLKRLYEKENAWKQNRQVQVCNKVPPSRGKRRSNLGGENKPMSKVRKQFQDCLAVRNVRAMKKMKASNEQLINIEKCAKRRDLSLVTGKRILEKEFGSRTIDEEIQKMKQRRMSCDWSEWYPAKLKITEEGENNVGDRLKRLYEKENARKQSRQVQVCNKVVPPSRVKRRSDDLGGETKPMNKVRKRFQDCLEVRNVRAMKPIRLSY